MQLIDTVREKDIQIGRIYPYDALAYGECLLSNKWSASLGVVEGDIVYMGL